MRKIKRIVLFRFHKEFDICKNHIKILRKFNPNIPIYGLYGGEESNYEKAKKIGVEDVFIVPLDDWYWKWRNGDLCIRWWYKKVGYKINFDMLHIVEWDMLFLDSVENYFKEINDGVAITHLQPLSLIYNTWTWTAPQQGRLEWLELKKMVKKKFNYKKRALAGIFGGACLSKKFLKNYAALENIPSLCNDEVRIPLFAQCLGFNVFDTRYSEEKLFNADGNELTEEDIINNYKKGITVYHPFRKKFNINKLAN